VSLNPTGNLPIFFRSHRRTSSHSARELTQATPRATALSAKSRREAAAKVFMEWLFSRETAKFITQIGRTSTRNDVERHPAALSNKQDFFVLADAEYFENYGKYVKLFDEIFMRRS
jgi:ABC-type Fe3+ transport system substrate-binding protein